MNVRLGTRLACAGLVVAGLATAVSAQTIAPAAAAAVADASRPDKDTVHDQARKPAEIVSFAGIKPGQKIGELLPEISLAPGGGYYARILSKVVGPSGHIYLLVPLAAQESVGKGAAALAASLDNATVLFQPGDSLAPPEPVDVVWTTDNYHDYHNPALGSGDIVKFNRAVFDALKPGGEFFVVDNQAAPGAGATQTDTLHRIEEGAVKREIAAAGFEFDGESAVLANPKDDHTLKIFDPAIRETVDQFVLRFRKPKQ